MLINISDVSFGYDDKTILENITACVNPKDKIGLVGVNGCGKSTLLKLILGEYTPDSGEILRAQETVVGYLRQNNGLESSRSVWDEMLAVFEPVILAHNELMDVSAKMSAVTDKIELKRLNTRYDYLTNYLNAKDGYNYEVKIRTVLSGMGMADSMDRIISEFSGGEKTRLALCKLLLSEPDILLLDEPTNHLDLDTITWLEKYLCEYKGAIVVVSHDRFFLDKTITQIWDIEDKALSVYRGNYTKYKSLKEERITSELREYEKQQIKIAAMKDYAQRNICRATTSNSAKSRLHQLENIEVLTKPRTYTKPPIFRFKSCGEPVKIVLDVKNLPITVADKTLVPSASFSVERGRRYGIVGMNGTGKSTMLKILINSLTKTSSNILWGKGVKVAYYDQENENLNPDNTIIDEVWGKNFKMSQTDVRSALACMLLSTEDINKKISVLSGGEKAKVSFCLLTLTEANTIILDEPTNHLDLLSREALEKGLREYEGTVIFVSHDRYFINRLATDIIEIADNNLYFFKGNYDDYKAVKQQAAERAAAEEIKRKKPQKTATNVIRDRGERVRIKQNYNRVESEIEQLEQRQSELGAMFASGELSTDYNLYNAKWQEHEANSAKLDALYIELEELTLLME